MARSESVSKVAFRMREMGDKSQGEDTGAHTTNIQSGNERHAGSTGPGALKRGINNIYETRIA